MAGLNRTGMYSGKPYELIYGPVADDDVYESFMLYSVGTLTKEETLRRLKVKRRLISWFSAVSGRFPF